MTGNAAGNEGERSRWTGLGQLLTIYVVWGTTYLAVRVGVREGSGFPAFWFSWSRLAVAGLLLLLYSWRRHGRLPSDRRTIATAGGAGLLMWTCAFGCNAWALQRLDSSFAAIAMGAIPIWGTLIESLLDRTCPSTVFLASTAIGIGGVVTLTLPELRTASIESCGRVLALGAAPVFWAAGAILQTRRLPNCDLLAGIGYQKLIGACGLLVLSIAFREPLPAASPDAWAAWSYMLVFGSLIAFLAFMRALRLLPARVVMTYAFVNPAIAALMGWLVLGEHLSGTDLGGMALIALGVLGALRERFRRQDGSPVA
jgi:drug/metabolite transporter (DMT)-like permease